MVSPVRHEKHFTIIMGISEKLTLGPPKERFLPFLIPLLDEGHTMDSVDDLAPLFHDPLLRFPFCSGSRLSVQTTIKTTPTLIGGLPSFFL